MKNPFADNAGVVYDEQQEGYSRSHLDADDQSMNVNNVVHGGAIFTLADTSMGAALSPTLNEGEFCATIEIKINYHSPGRTGRIECETNMLHRGKRIANLESKLYQNGKLIASANGHYAIIRPKKND